MCYNSTIENDEKVKSPPEPTTAPRRALNPVSSVDALFAALRTRILAGDLAPGDHLNEVELAETYGIGRYTVRAAFQKMVFRGIAVHRPNRGVSVLAPTPELVEDLYVYRASLETEAARVVVERALPLDGVVDALERLEGLADRADGPELLEADLAFHAALVGATGSSHMTRAFESIVDQVVLCLSRLGLEARAEIVADHRHLLDALRSDDAVEASQKFRAHLYRKVDAITGRDV